MELQHLARSFLVDWVGCFVILTLVSWVGLRTSMVVRVEPQKALACVTSAAAVYVVIVSPILRYAFRFGIGAPAIGMTSGGAALGLIVWLVTLGAHLVPYWLAFSFSLDAYVKVHMEHDAMVTAKSTIPAMAVWVIVKIALSAA